MILVTGASGHLGSRVMSLLKDLGHEVIGIGLNNVSGKIIRLDLTDRSAVLDFCQQNSVEICIHCASIMSTDSQRLPVAVTTEINVTGTANLLAHPWQKFIYVSTGSVFQGDHDRLTETTPPTPQTVYALTKRLAEIDVMRHSGITARVSWLYGPPVKASDPVTVRGPIPWIIDQLKTSSGVIAVPGGDFRASFTYVDDAARAVVRLALASSLAHDTYHIGPGQDYSVSDVAAILSSITGRQISVEHGTDPWGSMTRPRPALQADLITRDTGWRPWWTLSHGLESYWNLYV